MMKKIFALLLCAPLVLAACSNTKEQLGLTKHSPDEFAVMRRAPLSMPPDYALQPPKPGAPRPQEQASDEQAKQTIFGQSAGAQPGAAVSPEQGGETVLLQHAGATNADPNIRQEVDAETAKMAQENVPVAKKILNFASSKPPEAPASVVNAPAEAARIQKNKDQGKPMTTGSTPTIEK